ncbi:MAG TPA: GNAT family N-acetyltransferase [Polyangiaceae bacterium]|nr:GNAT family N-acetyltransferase [Polyangiaceae bacterium]
MISKFTFRPLTSDDLPLLHEWLNRAHVAEWWDDPRDLVSVVESFSADLDSPVIRMFLACLDDEPVGYIQVYRVMGANPEWWKDETDPGARGIDQFLANAEQLGKGLGSSMVRQFVASIFSDPEVTTVQTDPSPRNGRAIRAYEKAGFRRVAEVSTPLGPALLMRVARAEFDFSGSLGSSDSSGSSEARHLDSR